MEIRRQFAQVIANKLVSSGAAAESQVDQVKSLAESVASEVKTKAGDDVEINFERVSKALTGATSEANTEEGAKALKSEAKGAVDAFGNTFIFGYGSMNNRDFQSYDDGMFSFKGGNMAQKDVTFMVDTSPDKDGIQWMVLDNSKLPK